MVPERACDGGASREQRAARRSGAGAAQKESLSDACPAFGQTLTPEP
jgi:hypothetical protein